METLPFMFHTLEVEYPESSIAVSFGGGYEFTSAPKAPDQTEYTLNYEAMFFFQNTNGTLNKTLQPNVNMALLEDFYNRHKMYKKFIYPHPALGNLVVRFSQPLRYKIAKNGKGRVESFSLKIKLQP